MTLRHVSVPADAHKRKITVIPEKVLHKVSALTRLYRLNKIGKQRHKTTAHLSSQSLVCFVIKRVNDPSAGSPTETLLRLLLPLDDQVCPTSNCRK